MSSISFISIETIFEFLKFLDTNCDQLPGAAPKSTILIPFFKILNFSFISCNLYTALDLYPSILDCLPFYRDRKFGLNTSSPATPSALIRRR